MVRPGVVLDGILDELESGQADRVEGEVVRSTRILRGQRRRSQIVERGQPGPEDRADGVIPLEVDPADLPGSVIEIEVGGKVVVCFFILFITCIKIYNY